MKNRVRKALWIADAVLIVSWVLLAALWIYTFKTGGFVFQLPETYQPCLQAAVP